MHGGVARRGLESTPIVPHGLTGAAEGAVGVGEVVHGRRVGRVQRQRARERRGRLLRLAQLIVRVAQAKVALAVGGSELDGACVGLRGVRVPATLVERVRAVMVPVAILRHRLQRRVEGCHRLSGLVDILQGEPQVGVCRVEDLDALAIAAEAGRERERLPVRGDGLRPAVGLLQAHATLQWGKPGRCGLLLRRLRLLLLLLLRLLRCWLGLLLRRHLRLSRLGAHRASCRGWCLLLVLWHTAEQPFAECAPSGIIGLGHGDAAELLPRPSAFLGFAGWLRARGQRGAQQRRRHHELHILCTHNVQSRGCIRSRGCSSPADVDGSPAAPPQPGGGSAGFLCGKMPDLRSPSSSVGIDRSELRQSASPIINSHNEDAAADVWPLGGTSRRILAGLARTRRSPCQ